MERKSCKLTTLAEYNTFIKKHNHVILKAGAKWCGPCRRIKDLFNDLATNMPDSVKFGIIDIDDSLGIKRKLNIKKIPYMANIINGQVLDVVCGAIDKDIEGLFIKTRKRLD